MKKIAIQGIKGSFHDIAAHQYFQNEEIELICCKTFEEVFTNMRKDNSVFGMMAIENTIAGSLLHNYELLRMSGMRIIGEHKLHIEHSLLCLPEETIEDIIEVNSHPVALAQCQEFLAQHPRLKAVESNDTAGAAEMISQEHLLHHAAICSKEVAPIYGLKVLKEAIEDNKHNYTRFLALSDAWNAEEIQQKENPNKSSLVFSLPHKEGSLSQVLSIFSFYHINLSKIQSLPVIGHEWEYLFYVDVCYDDFFRFKQSIEAVRPLTKELKILGNYSAKK